VLQLQRRAEQMKKNLEQQEMELEEKMKAFEAEREAWEEHNRPDDQYDALLSFHIYDHFTHTLQFHGPAVIHVCSADNQDCGKHGREVERVGKCDRCY